MAVLLPLDPDQAEEEMVQAGKKAVQGNWDHYERLAEELRRAWPSNQSTQDLVDAIRR